MINIFPNTYRSTHLYTGSRKINLDQLDAITSQIKFKEITFLFMFKRDEIFTGKIYPYNIMK